MRIKLGLLDRKDALFYLGMVDVALVENGSYNIIGRCEILRDEAGRHFGELALDRNVSGDLFFYYRNTPNNGTIFVFSGIDLMENEIAGKPTVRLRYNIVG